MIRLLQIEDLAKLCRFFEDNSSLQTEKYFDPFPLNRQSAERLCKGDGNLYYIYESGGWIRGFCMIRFWGEFADVTTGILVGHEFRNRGLGCRLIAHVTEELRRLGRNCTAFIDLDNSPSIRIVEWAGFERAMGERYKGDRLQGIYRYFYTRQST